MKLLGAIAVYLGFAALIGWGIILAVQGNYWLLAIGFLAYLASLIKNGCLPAKPH